MSTKLQARAKLARKTAKPSLKVTAKTTVKTQGIAVIGPNGTTTLDSLDDYYAQVQDSLGRAAHTLVDQMNGTNVDLTLLDQPTLKSRQMTIGGKRFQVDIHCKNKAVTAIARHSGRDLGAILQIWNGSSSVMITVSTEALADARLNYRGEAKIAEQDTLSQAVAAFRLMAPDAASHHIAMNLAYEYPEVNASGCHSVWD